MADDPIRAPGDSRPETFTGRPEPLPPNPTLHELRRERDDLRRSNNGRFTIEEQKPNLAVLSTVPTRDPVLTMLVLMILLNTAKLCLLLWLLFLALQLRQEVLISSLQRAGMVNSLATLQHELEQGVAQQQVLTNRIDDVLVRLQQPAARSP